MALQAPHQDLPIPVAMPILQISYSRWRCSMNVKTWDVFSPFLPRQANQLGLLSDLSEFAVLGRTLHVQWHQNHFCASLPNHLPDTTTAVWRSWLSGAGPECRIRCPKMSQNLSHIDCQLVGDHSKHFFGGVCHYVHHVTTLLSCFVT